MNIVLFENNKKKLNLILEYYRKNKFSFNLIGFYDLEYLRNFIMDSKIDVFISSKEAFNKLEFEYDILFLEISNSKFKGEFYKYDSLEIFFRKLLFRFNERVKTKVINLFGMNNVLIDETIRYFILNNSKFKKNTLLFDLKYLSSESRKYPWDRITNEIINNSKEIDISIFNYVDEYYLYRPFNNEIDMELYKKEIISLLNSISDKNIFEYIFILNTQRISKFFIEIIKCSDFNFFINDEKNINFENKLFSDEIRKISPHNLFEIFSKKDYVKINNI